MDDTSETDKAETLPETLPIFPLSGVLLLPRGQLPLNIFEPRYLAMVEDALKAERMIGMIQPRDITEASPAQGTAEPHDLRPLYETGCAGRITSFSEAEDGRFLITLTGLCRFRVITELAPKSGYRRVQPDWKDFTADLRPADGLDINRDRLRALLSSYFDLNGLSCDWGMIDNAPDERLITCLSMICPLEPGEKQALLEAICCHRRAEMFMAMLELAVHGAGAEAIDPILRH